MRCVNLTIDHQDDMVNNVIALDSKGVITIECGYLLTFFPGGNDNRIICSICYGFNRKIGIQQGEIQ